MDKKVNSTPTTSDNRKVIGDLLHTHGLKKTPIRTEMLELFMNNDFALSASDILVRMKAENDRVTVYRALNSFEEHGILHIASEDGRGAKYALCSHNNHDEPHYDQHVHFVCDKCDKTFCLKDTRIPNVQISSEFLVNRIQYTLHGICKECKDKQTNDH